MFRRNNFEKVDRVVMYKTRRRNVADSILRNFTRRLKVFLMWRFLIFPVPGITVHKNIGWDIDNMKLGTQDFSLETYAHKQRT